MYSDQTREHARRLIGDGCTIAEAARTIGVDRKTVGLWFPEAPRLDRKQRAAWANFSRHSRAGLGL